MSEEQITPNNEMCIRDSPVTMDDLTSGFNIADNYSSSPIFNNMMGFNEQEVRTLIDYYKSYRELPHTTDELITIMKPWYDNYCFAMKALKEPSCLLYTSYYKLMG